MQIPLTQSKIALIDDEDWVLVETYKWWAVKSRSSDRYYAATKIAGKRIFMHQILTGWPTTDHRDSDGLNNRRSNLRECTNAQNSQNRRKQTGTTSRFKGVHLYQGKWRASIRKDRKLHHLGVFLSEEAAAAAYRAAAIELFGEFARF